MNNYDREIAGLKRQIAAAKAEGARLRRELWPGDWIHPNTALRLTAFERYLLACLLHRPHGWTREGLIDAMLRHRGVEDGDAVNARRIDTVICKLRRKLRPFGGEIKTFFGQGFKISRQPRDALILLLKAEAGKLDIEHARNCLNNNDVNRSL